MTQQRIDFAAASVRSSNRNSVKRFSIISLMAQNDPDQLNSLSHFRITARWVFPVSGPPLEKGVIEVVNGRIAAVHALRHAPAHDLGNVAIIPGLVNAHTHLEFSDLIQPVQPPQPFTAWIRSLVNVRRATPATGTILQQGLAECLANGAAAVGEIATQDWPDDEYRQSGTDAVVFRELIGRLPARAAAQLEVARNWLDASPSKTSAVTRGLSPHAPYSVSPDLYRDLVVLAAERQAPVAIHLAETASELELLSHGTGEFVDMLQRFNAWDDQAIPRGSRPLDYLQPLEKLTRALVIHGNYLQSEDFEWLSEHPQVAVVYCPRTHAFFGHPPHPWLRLLERNINVALGTDSRGSNPDLSLWNEMRFLQQNFPQTDPARILSMGTLNGARALGLDVTLGSIEPGKRAAFALVPLATDHGTDAYQTLFSSPHAVRLK